LAITDHH